MPGGRAGPGEADGGSGSRSGYERGSCREAGGSWRVAGARDSRGGCRTVEGVARCEAGESVGDVATSKSLIHGEHRGPRGYTEKNLLRREAARRKSGIPPLLVLGTGN